MTRIDIYKYTEDRQKIGNHNWQHNYIYVKIGNCFYRLHDLMEINILNESNEKDDNFVCRGKISILQKFIIRLKLIKRLWVKTR